MNKKTMIIIGIAVLVATVLAAFIMITAKKQEKQQPVRIACIGDSITYGFGLEPREGNDYPSQLQELLGNGYEVKNFGINGAAAQLSVEASYAGQPFFNESKEYMPQIVLIMLGTNDSTPENWDKERFIRDYAFFAESYRPYPNVEKVYLLLPPPVYLEEGGDGVPRGSVVEQEVVPMIRSTAEELGLETIDLFSVFADRPELLEDGCHPNKEGARLIARTVYEVIVRAQTEETA